MSPNQLLYEYLALKDGPESSKWLEVHAHLLKYDELETNWKGEAQQLAYKGEKDQAIRLYEAIKWVGESTDQQIIVGLAHWVRANINVITGEYGEAAKCFKRCSYIFKSKNEDLLWARMSVGYVGALVESRNFKEALEISKEAEPILKKSIDPQDYTNRFNSLLINQANLAVLRGRTQEAIELYYKTLNLWQHTPDSYEKTAQMGRTQNNIGHSKLSLNLLDEAEHHLKIAFDLLSRLGDDWLEDLIRIVCNLAVLSMKQNRSEIDVEAAMNRFKEIKTKLNDTVQSDYLYVELAHLFWRLNQPKSQVIGSIQKDLNIIQQDLVKSAVENAEAGYLRALCHYKQFDFDASIELLTKLDTETITLELWELRYQVNHLLGLCYFQLNNNKRCEIHWEKSVEIIEKFGKNLGDADLRANFLHDKRQIYDSLIQFHLQKGGNHNIFKWVEKIKNRSFVDIQEGKLNREANHQDAPSHNPIDNDLERIEHRRKKAQNPTSLEHAFTQSKITLADLSEKLSPNHLYLNFFIINEEIWVLPISSTKFFEPVQLGPQISLQDLDSGYSRIAMVSNMPEEILEKSLNQLILSAQIPLNAWYEQIFRPIEELISQFEILIISPDKNLHRLPFHALFNSKTGSYLIETHEILISAGAYALTMSKPRDDQNKTNLAVGYDGDTLSFAENEVSSIAQEKNWVCLIGNDATKVQVSSLMKRAKNIHLATHVFFRADNPSLSSIELVDGKLLALDILDLELDARLVVLSCCESGRGEFRGGENIGLVRSFLLSGAESVLATLWVVDDKATFHLFSFTDSEGMNYADSFFNNIRGILKENKNKPSKNILVHPFYWGAYFLTQKAYN
ncbi:MAG: CHAT domain-containing tetratricopeptide repeat protein [Chloroflexota bacterium]